MSQNFYIIPNNELYHYGVLGMKWGCRKNKYNSTSIKAAIARKQNEKIDKSFKKWNENTKKRDNAIDYGKKRNVAKLAYESDKSKKNLKSEYKAADKEYKKSLGKNTTYRKGVIRQEVGSDLSRKYMSAAKKVKKQMNAGGNDKALQKQYAHLMSQHDIERAKARRAVKVGSARSNKKAAVKRAMTMSLKATVGTAALTGGTYAVNKYLQKKGANLKFSPNFENVEKYVKVGKKIINFAKMMY